MKCSVVTSCPFQNQILRAHSAPKRLRVNEERASELGKAPGERLELST
jgi:hypothetical protein